MLGTFAKLRKATPSFVMSVCPYWTRLPPNWFSWNVVSEYFSKTYRANSSFIKIWHEQRVLYIRTNKHLWSFLNQFCLEWVMFHTNVVEKIKTRTVYSKTPPENRAVYEITWKSIFELDRPLMTIWRIRIAHWMPMATNTRLEYVIITTFHLQQWLHERASMLRYRYIACLVNKWNISTFICWMSLCHFTLLFPADLGKSRKFFCLLSEPRSGHLRSSLISSNFDILSV